MKNKVISKIIYIIVFFSISDITIAQTDTQNISKIKSAVKQFFIDKGEINSSNKLDIGIYDVADGSGIENREKSVYIIRTEYTTDGTDYLLFKNGQKYEILDFSNLKLIINKTFELFPNETDDVLFKYIKGLSKWYEDYQYIKNNSRYRLKFIKKEKG